MADFKSMMAAKNKKSNPVEQVASIEANIVIEETPKVEEKRVVKPQKTAPVKTETVNIDQPDKTNLSLSRTSANYIKINAKRQRKSQSALMTDIVKKQQKIRVPAKINYEDYGKHKRLIIDRTTINLILPHDLMEWVKTTSAEEGIAISQFIDEIIQKMIEEES